MTNTTKDETLPDLTRQTLYLTVAETAQKIGVFSELAIRAQISKASENGLEPALRRVAGRVLVHWPSYLAWIDNPPPPKPLIIKNRRGRKPKPNKPYNPGKLVEVESGWLE